MIPVDFHLTAQRPVQPLIYIPESEHYMAFLRPREILVDHVDSGAYTFQVSGFRCTHYEYCETRCQDRRAMKEAQLKVLPIKHNR